MAVIMWLMHADMTSTQWCSWGGGGEKKGAAPSGGENKIL